MNAFQCVWIEKKYSKKICLWLLTSKEKTTRVLTTMAHDTTRKTNHLFISDAMEVVQLIALIPLAINLVKPFIDTLAIWESKMESTNLYTICTFRDVSLVGIGQHSFVIKNEILCIKIGIFIIKIDWKPFSYP